MNDQEILEALKKSVAMPPALCMNERSVIYNKKSWRVQQYCYL